MIHTVARLEKDAQGNPIKVRGIIQDITERKFMETEIRSLNTVLEQRVKDRTEALVEINEKLKEENAQRLEAEETLRESEKRFRDLAEMLPQNIWECDTSGKVTFVNHRGCEMYGYTPEDVEKEMTIWQTIHPDDRERVIDDFIQALTQEPCEFPEFHEFMSIRKDGSTFPCITYHVPIVHGNKITGMRGIAIDITERKRAEDALRMSEEKYRTLFDSAGDAIFIHDADAQILAVNRMACERLGYTQTEMLSMNVQQVDSPEDALQAQARIARLMERGYILFETRHRCKDGSFIPFEVSAQRIIWEGQPAVMSICHDITERNRAEEIIRESEEKYRSLAEQVHDGIFIYQGDHLIFTNSHVSEISGYSKEELLAMPFIDLVHPDDREYIRNLAKRRLQGEPAPNRVVCRFVRKDGAARDVEVVVSVIHYRGGYAALGAARDITERKQAEEQLRAEHDLVIALASTVALRDGLNLCLANALHISGMDSGGIYLVNEKTGDLDMACSSGLSDEFVKEVSYIRADSDSAHLVLAGRPIYTQHMQLGVPFTGARAKERLRALAVIPILSKNRVIACFNIASHTHEIVPEESKTILESIAALIGNGIARFVAEEATRASEERYRMLFEGASEGILVADTTTEKFLYANTAISRMLGYSKEELTAMGLEDIHPVKDLDIIRKYFYALGSGEKKMVTNIPFLKKDKTVLYVEIVASQIMIDKKLCFVGFLLDITDRKRVEAALQQANKKLTLLSSITRHDINNQLTVLQGYLSILEQKQSDVTFDEYLGKVSTAAQRISSMIQFTKEYETIGVNSPSWQDCRILIDTAAKEAPLGQIILKNDLPAGSEVFADPLIIKVCYNLMDNAVR
jgi:PAS domain S-box-containing protein